MIRWARRLFWAWLAWRALGPQRPPRFDGPQERPLPLVGRSVLVGGREFFVREAGPEIGWPLVLVHGWGADSLLNWYKVIPSLVERHRIIAVDQRGHGKSDRVREGYRVEAVADELAGVLDDLGIEVASLVGYSLGGMVAQAFVRRHPERVTKLVLAATAARVPLRGRRLRKALFWAGRGLERLSGTEGAWLRYRYLLRRGAVEAHHARWLWETFMDRDPTLFYDAGFAALDFDGREWATRLARPVLVVIPTEDQLVPPRAQYELAALIPGASVAELVGAGHEACLTHADDLAKVIDRFLAEG
jgi:3-oxoadipate enol-lactonase